VYGTSSVCPAVQATGCFLWRAYYRSPSLYASTSIGAAKPIVRMYPIAGNQGGRSSNRDRGFLDSSFGINASGTIGASDTHWQGNNPKPAHPSHLARPDPRFNRKVAHTRRGKCRRLETKSEVSGHKSHIQHRPCRFPQSLENALGVLVQAILFALFLAAVIVASEPSLMSIDSVQSLQHKKRVPLGVRRMPRR